MTLSLSAAADTPAPADHPATEVSTCWNQIGVYGDGSCGELAKYVHCRNCPVHSDAALQLLDRPLPGSYRREWTAHFAAEEKLAPPAKTSALLFRIHSEWLGLPTQAFQEVAERRLIHSLPHRRAGLVLGLANIRGELLICVALGRLLGLEPSSPSESGLVYDRLLVVNWEGQRLVFPVDEVHGIQRFQNGELKELPATVARSNPSYSRGILVWQQRAVGFLDAQALFSNLNRSLT